MVLVHESDIREIIREEQQLLLGEILHEMDTRYGSRSVYRKDHALKIGSFFDLIAAVKVRL